MTHSQAATTWASNIILHTELLRAMRAGRFRQFQRAIGEAGWHFLMGTAALLDGDHERATDLLSKGGEAPEVLFNLALALQTVGEEGRSRRLMAKAEEMAPDLVKAHLEPLPTPLRITYLLPNLANTGGMRVIVEQMKGLARRGHEVRALYLAYPGVVPDARFAGGGIELVPVSPLADFTSRLPPSDFIVACFWDQLFSAFEARAGFPLYLAQGDSWIFAPEWSPGWMLGLLRDLHRLPVAILAVSSFLRGAIERLAGRRAAVIHPGLDWENFSQPGIGEVVRQADKQKAARIVLVAPDGGGYEFKGVGDIVEALEMVRRDGFVFDAIWITPFVPERSFPGRVVVGPPRRELARILAEADLYVCGSHYEAFPLPPLEAMAAGTAVVSTRNGGVEEYAVDGWNCLLVPPRDPPSLAAAMERLLRDPALRARLVEHGLETARSYSWEASIDRLEQFIGGIAARPRPIVRPVSRLQAVGGGSG